MAEDGVRLVGFFKRFDLAVFEMDFKCGESVIEMMLFAGADDRRGNVRLGQHPG